MDRKASLLADALVTPRWCVGCGHDERMELTHGPMCCPQHRYLTITEIMSALKNAERAVDEYRGRAHRAEEEKRARYDRERERDSRFGPAPRWKGL